MCAGFLLGSRETLLETKDSGRTWEPRSVAAAQDEGALVLVLAAPGACHSACVRVILLSRGSPEGSQRSSPGQHGRP